MEGVSFRCFQVILDKGGILKVIYGYVSKREVRTVIECIELLHEFSYSNELEEA